MVSVNQYLSVNGTESKYSPFYSEWDSIEFLIDVNDSLVLYSSDVNISYYTLPIIISLGFCFLVFLICLNDLLMKKVHKK